MLRFVGLIEGCSTFRDFAWGKDLTARYRDVDSTTSAILRPLISPIDEPQEHCRIRSATEHSISGEWQSRSGLDVCHGLPICSGDSLGAVGSEGLVRGDPTSSVKGRSLLRAVRDLVSSGSVSESCKDAPHDSSDLWVVPA